MSFSAAAADERVLDVAFSDDALSVSLRDGRVISVPLVWYPRLLNATPAQRNNWKIAGGGYGIHWPDLDEDLSTEGLLRGAPAPKVAEFPKAANPLEFLVWTELLPAIRKRYGGTFALLEIPEVLRWDRTVEGHGTVYFRRYEGETYNHKWSEQDGGGSLGTELSSEMVRLLEDLQRIDVRWLLSLHPAGKSVEESAFDLPKWLLSFRERRSSALSMGISDDDLKQAEEFIKDGFESARRIFSNGDFYPRNLVRFQEKIVLVDWAHWPGCRACFVDYLVNVAAFAFIHMWGNSLWQKHFFHRLMESFDIELEDFRRAVLIKSFEQAMYWIGLPDLARVQINLFKQALNNDMFH